MIKASKEFLMKSDNPSITNVSSIAGIKGIGSSIAYAASKGALNTMTISMARNLGPIRAVSYTHLPSPRDGLLSRMPSSA